MTPCLEKKFFLHYIHSFCMRAHLSKSENSSGGVPSLHHMMVNAFPTEPSRRLLTDIFCNPAGLVGSPGRSAAVTREHHHADHTSLKKQKRVPEGWGTREGSSGSSLRGVNHSRVGGAAPPGSVAYQSSRRSASLASTQHGAGRSLGRERRVVWIVTSTRSVLSAQAL